MKAKLKNIFPPALFLPRLNFPPKSFTSTPHQAVQMRNGDCSQLIPSCVSCSFFLTLLPCSGLGSVLVDSPSRTALAWLLSSGCSPWGADCSSVVPHGITDPARKAPAWAPLHGACQEPVPAEPFHGQQLPSGHIHLLQQGLLHGLHYGYLLTCGHFQCP